MHDYITLLWGYQCTNEEWHTKKQSEKKIAEMSLNRSGFKYPQMADSSVCRYCICKSVELNATTKFYDINDRKKKPHRIKMKMARTFHLDYT